MDNVQVTMVTAAGARLDMALSAKEAERLRYSWREARMAQRGCPVFELDTPDGSGEVLVYLPDVSVLHVQLPQEEVTAGA